jgi:cytochrome b involved in lipid metabolism
MSYGSAQPNTRMNNTINYDDEQRQELIELISDVLNETGAYNELHKLLVDREEVILHSDMENLACEIEDFIFNWTQIEE